MPRLSPDTPGLDGEIAVLRSLTNRLLSKPSLDHTYLSRYLRILVRAVSARSRMPKQLTDEEEVDSLIKKYFHKKVENGDLSLYNLLPVRTARPGDKWWPWRNLVPVEERHRDGLIGLDDRRPSDLDEYLEKRAAMDAKLAEIEEMELSLVDDWFEPEPDDDDPYPNNPYTDPDPDDETEQWPDPYDETEQWPDPYDEDENSPDRPDPDPPTRPTLPRIARGRPPP